MPEGTPTQPSTDDCIIVGSPQRWSSPDGQDDRDNDDDDDVSSSNSDSDYVEDDEVSPPKPPVAARSMANDDPDASFNALNNTSMLKARFQLSPNKPATGRRVCNYLGSLKGFAKTSSHRPLLLTDPALFVAVVTS